MSDSSRAAGSDDLLRDFRGGGLMKPLVLTLVVHVVVILATSVPYLKAAFGGGKADLTEQERLDAAVKEATASLQEIAKEHGVRPQDLGSRFSAGGKTSPATKPTGTEKSPGSAKPGPAKPAAAPTPPADAPKPDAWGAAGQATASDPKAGEPKPDAPAPPPPGPALPEVKDDVDLFK